MVYRGRDHFKSLQRNPDLLKKSPCPSENRRRKFILIELVIVLVIGIPLANILF